MRSKLLKNIFVSFCLTEKGNTNIVLRDGAGWSSLVARRAHNPKVVGSNPAPATNSQQILGLDLAFEVKT